MATEQLETDDLCTSERWLMQQRSVSGQGSFSAGMGASSGPQITNDPNQGKKASFAFRVKSELKRINSTLRSSSNASSVLGGGGAVKTPRNLKFDRTVSSAQRGLKSLRFLDKNVGGSDSDWRSVEKRFDQLSVNGQLSRENFGACIGMKDSKEFALEIFDALARRKGIKTDCLGKEELRQFWHEMADQNFDSRLQIFFDMCDKNGDGRISEDEVKEVIVLSASANRLAKLKENAAQYAGLIMEELDPDHRGYIEIWQLEELLQGMVKSYGNEELEKRSKTLRRTMIPKRWRSPVYRHLERARDFLHENWKRVWIMALWLCLNAGIFAWKFYQYRHKAAYHIMGYCVCAAKGAAETLKLNMAMILFPVCRNTITWLRSTFMGRIVPFDDNINFHKVIALGIVAGTVTHVGVHLTCDFPRLINCPAPKFQHYLGSDFHFHQPTWGSLLSSVVGVTGVLMVIVMSFSFTLATHSFRRNVVKLPWPLHKLAGFNAFWYAHHLFVLVYTMLILHGIHLYLTHKWYKKTVSRYLEKHDFNTTLNRYLVGFHDFYTSIHLTFPSCNADVDVLGSTNSSILQREASKILQRE
eukprot:TRINITY_DN7776_c0_g1_i2.p1 TRINITY_DN7776_c0_g1~~TRINITY_DN7776_c0_g1_i2.p1  ORF type:complete len:585 (-),score=75.70 TRINITY_DN7776_c0_g1_i2:1329-3083(-)